MNSSGQRSAAVNAAGVIAILGSIFSLIGILFTLLGVFVASSIPNSPGIAPGLRLFVGVMMTVLLAFPILGIATGVGLIRFRNWARISALVWSGITGPICLIAVAAMLFVPVPMTPGHAIPDVIFRLIVSVFYVAPLAVTIWWLILFTRPRIVAQFQPGVAGAAGDPFTALVAPANATADPSGFASPLPAAYLLPAVPSQPSIPIPIIVLACFFLISAASVSFIFFMHVPAMVFGHAFTGLTGSVIYATWCLLYAVAGVGMLRRISWAYSVAIGVQILGIVGGIMTVLSPNFDSMMRRAMTNMSLPPPEVYSTPSMAYLRGFSIIGLLFPIAILGLLVYYRPEFLKSAERAAAPEFNTPA
jgi:hypothetical protein